MTQQLTRQELQQIVREVPMLSPSASQLLKITTQPDHDLVDIINLVKADAYLTARILTIVNSAAFGLVNKVTSIDRAIAYLGERIVVSAAVDDCAGKLFKKDLAGYAAGTGALWQHDLRTAIAAREVAIQSRTDLNPELAFTAGLLHDIGKSLISDYLKDNVPEAMELIKAGDSLDYLSVEEKLIGCAHTEAGYELAVAWQLPPELTAVIRYHHEPDKAEQQYQSLIYAVHLGDNIAMLGGYGTGADSMHYKLDQRYADYVDINTNSLANIVLSVDLEYKKLQESFSVSGEED